MPSPSIRAPAPGTPRARPKRRLAAWLPLIGLLLASACGSCGGCFGCGSEDLPDRPPLPEQDVSLFSDSFQFECSPDRQVGCDGVFPIRRPAGDLPSEVAVLPNGDSAFRQRIALIEGAKRSIRIQALIFRGDEAGLTVSEVLKQKAAAGVDVRVIVDALSNLDRETQWMYFDLKQHGIEVEGYETLYLNWLVADLSITDPLRSNKRFHDKVWVVDAEHLPDAQAIVGGLNIANEYFRVDDEPINRWRDQDVLVRGAIVKDITRAFDRNYDYLKSLKERLPSIFNPDNSWRLSRAVLKAINNVPIPDWKDARIEAGIQKVLAVKDKLEFQPITARFLQSRPRFKEGYIAQAYLHLFRRAKERIDIANAYFVPSRELIEALKAAARRGVHVRILTNSPITNDIAPVATISRHLYAELLDVNDEPAVKPHHDDGRGLEIWEWVGPEKNEGTLHAKFALIDQSTALVGSYNLDPRSEHLNSETAIALDDWRTVHRLRTIYEKEDLPLSRKVPHAEARSYRDPDGLKEKFNLLFSLPMKGWL